MQPKSKTIPEGQVPEVLRFLEAKERFDNLRAAYPEVFEQLSQITEEYNASLEAAEKMVRSKQVSCGPFVLFQTQTKYDAEKLYEEVGRDRFLEVGGTVKTVTTFEIDKARLESHIAANTIPPEVVAVIREVSPRYKKPEKINGL